MPTANIEEPFHETMRRSNEIIAESEEMLQRYWDERGTLEEPGAPTSCFGREPRSLTSLPPGRDGEKPLKWVAPISQH